MTTTNDLINEVNAEHDSTENAVLEGIRATAPVLSARAMLVLCNISVWEGRKMDKHAAKQLAADNNADEEVFSAYKSLMGKDCDELDAIKKLRGEVRNHIHYYFTQPWSDSGLRFLTTAAYFDYHKLMTQAQQDFTDLVTAFLSRYQNHIAVAQYSLGDRYNPDDYPTTDELREKFRFDIEYIPLPEAGDFRVEMEQEVIDHLTNGYEKFYSEQFSNAMRDVWDKLKEPLANMVDKLDYPMNADKDQKKRFKGTIVDNVLKIVDLMEVVNVHGDTHMAAVQQKLKGTLQGITPESLRDDDSLRQHIQKEAAQAL
jgi:hypothetical protein